MRILVYPHDLNMGGSQTNAIDLASALTARGHECIIFGRRGTLCERIEQLGLEFIESPEPGRRPSLRIARALRAIAVERGIDVIHGYEWPPGLEAAMAAEPLADVAAVCTVMSMAVAPFLPEWMPLVVGTQQISAVEQGRGRLSVNLIEPSVDLGYNGAVPQTAIAAFRAQYGLDERPVVVSVCRLVPELKSEGLFTAIEVAADLAATAPFQLLIVGDGKARDDLERAAARAEDRAGRRTVVFTGELADPRVAYAVADVALGMGGSALRSLAFGAPLIVQGEGGFFRALTPESVDIFRWQGWYGVGAPGTDGRAALAKELLPLLTDPHRRERAGRFSREVVEEFSLESAAHRQLAVYRDAWAGRAAQKRRLRAAAESFAGLANYHLTQRVARWRGRQRTDDFNAVPVAARSAGAARRSGAVDSGPILYFPGVGWDTLSGTDRLLVTELARHAPIVWVDTPHTPIHKRDRGIPAVTRPQENVVRLRASTVPGVQRPYLRAVANRRRARAARRYLAAQGLRPRGIVASTTAPMLALTKDLPGVKVYYATDDFVEAGALWGVGRGYLSKAREANLAAADLVLAVTPELARHLQRTPTAGRWLPNGTEVHSPAAPEVTTATDVVLPSPIVGVVGQFNSRTDLAVLRAVQAAGLSLLLVGPRWFTTREDDEAFDALIALPGVQWVDAVPRERLPAYLALMTVGLTPYADSMFNRRSYPLKTLDYLAAGLPVVTTAVAGTGALDRRFVFTAGSADEIVDRIREVAAAEWDRAEIRRSAEPHGWGARAQQFIDLVKEDHAS